MAHFNLENELNNALRLDEPLKQGPVPRWQRKQKDKSPEINSTNTSLNCSTPFLNVSANKSTSKIHVSPFKGLYISLVHFLICLFRISIFTVHHFIFFSISFAAFVTA